MSCGAPGWDRTPSLLPAPCEPHSLCKVRVPNHSRTTWLPQSHWVTVLGKGLVHTGVLPHPRDHIRQQLVDLPQELSTWLISSMSFMKIPMVTWG